MRLVRPRAGVASSWGLVVGLVAAHSLETSAAHAQALAPEVPAPSASGSSAQEHYARGRESFRAGLYGRALEAFEASLAASSSPNTRLYVARSLRELGRWSEAAEQYRATIREATERGGRYLQAREAAEVELRDVLVRIERGDPSPGADPGAVPRSGAGASAPASPGSASVTTPTTVVPERSPDVAHVPPTARSGPPLIAWVAGGAAVAAGVASGVLYAMSDDRHAYLEENCARVRTPACDEALASGKRDEVVAYALLGVAVAAAAVAVVSIVLEPSNKRASAAKVVTPWRVAF